MAEKTKKSSLLKKMGSLTMVPYALKSAGYDELADTMGYPYEDDGSRKPGSEIETSMSSRKKRGEKINAPRYSDDPISLAKKALGFKNGGCVIAGRGGKYKGSF